jgi:hypothetical protein
MDSYYAYSVVIHCNAVDRPNRPIGCRDPPPGREKTSSRGSSDPMSKLSITKEAWLLLREHKKFWLVPIVILLLLIGVLLVFAQTSVLAPFIYTIF